MYLRNFGLGHCTAKTLGTPDALVTEELPAPHRIRSFPTHSASRAISASDRPLDRWISVRAILPLVMSRASTSTRPLLPTPQRTWTGAPLGKLGGKSSIQHSPMLIQASSCGASPWRLLTAAVS